MADAGFFYNKTTENFHCFNCNVVISSWKKGEKPMIVHKNKNPNCAFVRGLDDEDDESSDDDDDNDDVVDGGQSGNSDMRRNLVSDGSCDRQPISNLSGTIKDKNELRRQNETLSMTCKNCRKQKIQTLFLPCRHLVTCEACADAMDNCLVCKATILGTVRTYFG
jgi:hypothetical protein